MSRKNILNGLLLLLCIMTIAYASFQSHLNIVGAANISSKFDVEIEMPIPTAENTADVCEWLKQPAE